MKGTATGTAWRLLNEAGHGGAAAGVLAAVTLLAVAVMVAAVLALSVPDLDPALASLARQSWGAAATALGLEYLARLWSAVGAPAAEGGALRLRWVYAVSFLGIVDLVASAPFWLAASAALPVDMAEVLSLLALCKLARYLPGLGVLTTVFRSEARALLAALAALVTVLVVTSGVMFLLERAAQPEVFSSIPRAMWWGIVTIASVGYGDMTPVTAWGRVFGGLVIVVGLSAVAVPVGILANGFYRELRKHDFVVTWRTVAAVPLFQGLDASRIAEIARVLKPQLVPERQVVVRRGEPARAMFFILDGKVEVDVRPTPVRLGKGQFFGEIALLRDIQCTATVTTLAETSLLVLEVDDFRKLVQRYPDIRDAIARTAEARVKSDRPAAEPPA
jgi:voltage-gated potassium channel